MTAEIENPTLDPLAPLRVGTLSGQSTPALLRLGVCVAAALAMRACRSLLGWHDRVTSRWELSRLDPYILQDVGLRRDQVETELKKWFWQE